jgi:hypothetical protein
VARKILCNASIPAETPSAAFAGSPGEQGDLAKQLAEQRASIGGATDQIGRTDRKGLHGLQANSRLDDEDRLAVFGPQRKPAAQMVKMRAIAEIDVDDAVGRGLRIRNFAAPQLLRHEQAGQRPADGFSALGRI